MWKRSSAHCEWQMKMVGNATTTKMKSKVKVYNFIVCSGHLVLWMKNIHAMVCGGENENKMCNIYLFIKLI